MVRGLRWWWGAALLPYAAVLATGVPQTPAKPVDFAKEIQPIFKASCYQCHGKDVQLGNLRMDTKQGLLKGGVSGKLYLPKQSVKSLLLIRMLGTDGKPRMPMGFAPLPKTKSDLIKRWIDEGATINVAEEPALHWAYVAPVEPTVPTLKDPWIRGPIDSFTLQTMREQGLQHAPEASRETLIRRVTLDLTGLPPTLAELDAFLADRRPDAYERVVDRLLASPQYGEHQASQWLDLARYADTNGYEKDDRRSMWPYRDWVIRAFNEDMPYDRFTVLQIAGDLMPDAGLDGKIATGFHRNTMTNLEGGVDREEQRWLTLVDRVATTGTVWMGTTLGCAQCHDHKFDPISIEEFYEFLAFFDNSDEPSLELPSEAIDKRRTELRQQISALEASPLDEEGKKQLAAVKKELEGVHGPTTLVLAEKDAQPQTILRVKGSFLAKGPTLSPGVPEVFPALPSGADNNRLGLARWLVDPANPLTARVEANRLWERVFGKGLLQTSEDFGTQSSPPTHPELLDWLALKLVDEGWSLKTLLHEIVTSATYRQTSSVSKELHAKDSTNRWLSRGPRFRLEAEALRDGALAIGGLLSLKMGGPSVFPDQPAGVWHSPYSGDDWKMSTGEDRWRRGVYTFIKRTAPYPFFMAFDATSRETCTVRRLPTNTPLQALATLNDSAFVEAAKGLADQMLVAKSPFAFGFRLATSRVPSAGEASKLEQLYRSQQAHFDQNPGAAKELAGSRDRAAMTIVANVILNLDETLTKG